MAKSNPQKKSPGNPTISSAAYDTVPYTSYPFSQTSPLLLQGIAKIFGLNAPDPSKARILEIGCSSGNNILAIAGHYPETKCVGFDYSAVQIERGQQDIKAMGLTNIELKHLSVMDVKKDFGMFDYIICHGVLSWVPPEVQNKIFEVCKNNLSPSGVAYISYNTLPGWNSVRSVRDMLLYHTARFEDPTEKASQSRQLLKFIGDAMRANNNPSASIIDRESEILQNQADYYLLHEHLEENNYAFYFHDFMEKAGQVGLQYLAETSLERMFSGNFPPATAEVLATSNDLVRTEQYMDYIYDRRFRSTLLCHKDNILNRNIQSKILLEGWLQSRFAYPAEFESHDITGKVILQFAAPSGMILSSDDPVVLAMLQVFQAQKSKPIQIRELTKLVRKKLTDAKYPIPAENDKSLDEIICQYAIRHLFIGGMNFYVRELPFTNMVSKKPVMVELSRFQAMEYGWVCSPRQEHISLNVFDRVLMQYLDGTHDMASLCEVLLPHFASKELVMNDYDVPLEDPVQIKERLPNFIKVSLDRYAELGLLVK